MAVKVPTSMSRLFGSKRAAIGILSAIALFMMSVNYDLIETARMMALHEPYSRELRTLDLGNGQCSIDLSEDAATDPVAENATHTLLTSYPGSGKRFTWMAIKALTNHEIAGDWDFSGTLDLKPLTVKTSWPHHEGNWNWGSQMDQVLLLVRNPRWAIPSYHNLRFELNYSNGYADSVKRILNTYTSRPNVKQWEDWRDANAETEIDLWAEFIDFWMSGGIESGTNTTHEYCLTRGIDCKPVAVMDFDRFYEEHPNSEVFKLDNVLQSSANVEVVASAIHACVLDKIRDGATDSSGNVMGHNNMRAQNTGIHAHAYKFTSDLMQQMIDKVVELKTKYSAAEYADQVAAQELVTILEVYYADLVAENNIAGH